VRDKLYSYGLRTDDVENLISKLIADNYVNEERFARAYAGGKFRIKKWGKHKIKAGLRAKKISEYCMKKALEEINEKEYLATLRKILENKAGLLKEKNAIRKKYKLLNYAAAKGYEQGLIMEILNEDI
ncbi:MAG TPA: regulatory protein RecX, partial [Bacteroidia bacterium]|nr:regulatory protein RecX [Bacteroidia bacterium]